MATRIGGVLTRVAPVEQHWQRMTMLSVKTTSTTILQILSRFMCHRPLTKWKKKWPLKPLQYHKCIEALWMKWISTHQHLVLQWIFQPCLVWSLPCTKEKRTVASNACNNWWCVIWWWLGAVFDKRAKSCIEPRKQSCISNREELVSACSVRGAIYRWHLQSTSPTFPSSPDCALL